MSDADPPDARGNGFDQRFSAMYDELRQLAGRCIVRDRDTLHPTALVHEAYLRCRKTLGDPDDGHLRALLVTAMRHILVDHARARSSQKRGGWQDRVTLDDSFGASTAVSDEIVRLDEALTLLAGVDQRKSRVVELKYFGGMTNEEVATALGVSPETVKRDWRFSRNWLLRELTGGSGGE